MFKILFLVLASYYSYGRYPMTRVTDYSEPQEVTSPKVLETGDCIQLPPQKTLGEQ